MTAERRRNMDLSSLITSGVKKRPVKAVIYGVEGIGKTTFASRFPKPLFLDLDRGSAHMDVARITGITKWDVLIRTIKGFIEMENNPYRTLVIDTADAAASLCERYVVSTQSAKKKSIEEIPYGKGYKMLAEQFSNLMIWLEAVIDAGFNVVMIAHARLRTITKPDDMGVYDHWELKLPGNSSNQLSPLIKEWADLLLFADYKTRLVGDGEKKKARGGERIMYTAHTPFADAKNRFGLDDSLPFDYEQISGIIPAERIQAEKTVSPSAFAEAQKKAAADRKAAKASGKAAGKTKSETLAARLIGMAAERDISADDIRKAVGMMGDYPESTPVASYDAEYLQSLVDQWEQFKMYIEQNIKGVPF